MGAIRENIEAAIEGISLALKGPRISNAERLMLHEDRKDLRRKLDELDAPVLAQSQSSEPREEDVDWDGQG